MNQALGRIRLKELIIMKSRFAINRLFPVGLILAIGSAITAMPPSVFAGPQIVVSPGSLAVTNVLGGFNNVTLTVSNASMADASLTFSIFACETGRSNLIQVISSAELPLAQHDFTKAAADKAFATNHLLVRFDSDSGSDLVRAVRIGRAAEFGPHIVPGERCLDHRHTRRGHQRPSRGCG